MPFIRRMKVAAGCFLEAITICALDEASAPRAPQRSLERHRPARSMRHRAPRDASRSLAAVSRTSSSCALACAPSNESARTPGPFHQPLEGASCGLAKSTATPAATLSSAETVEERNGVRAVLFARPATGARADSAGAGADARARISESRTAASERDGNTY